MGEAPRAEGEEPWIGEGKAPKTDDGEAPYRCSKSSSALATSSSSAKGVGALPPVSKKAEEPREV